jgi:hypothetical protein
VHQYIGVALTLEFMCVFNVYLYSTSAFSFAPSSPGTPGGFALLPQLCIEASTHLPENFRVACGFKLELCRKIVDELSLGQNKC